MGRAEFVMTCEDMGAGVWSPDGLFAHEGVNERIIRCRDCAYARFGAQACALLDESEEMFWVCVEPDGFCSWGEPREVDQ